MSLYGLQRRIVVLGMVLAWVGVSARGEAQSRAGTVIVYLDPMTTAGVGGTVNLAPNGPGTNFEVTLNPGESAGEEREYKVQVAQGSCSTPGRVIQDFDKVHADGKATRQEGSLRLADVRNGQHIIQVAAKHEVVSCGMIPAARH
jgi:hypothetical protein